MKLAKKIIAKVSKYLIGDIKKDYGRMGGDKSKAGSIDFYFMLAEKKGKKRLVMKTINKMYVGAAVGYIDFNKKTVKKMRDSMTDALKRM
jgi:hypothetical protein